jgi:calcium-dependent protein kinase
LQKDPSKRPKIEEVLNDDWFKLDPSQQNVNKLNVDVLNRLKTYRNEIKFKKAAMSLLVNFCNDKDIKDMMSTFKCIDVDNNGVISIGELKTALQNIDQILPKEEVDRIMEVVDVNNTGVINYSEFLAATLDKSV